MQRRLNALLLCLAASGCGILPGPAPNRLVVWHVASPAIAGNSAISHYETSAALIGLDTVGLRPLPWGVQRQNPVDSAKAPTAPTRTVLFTTYRGTRYHPEAIRALTEDTLVLDRFATALATMAGTSGSVLLLDLQEAPPSDLPRLVSFIRAIASSIPERAELGVVVPAGDTLGYPIRVLARVADVIVVRLDGEHGQGTAPGAPTTPDFVRRELGTRAIGIGSTRIVAAFPVYGLIWRRDESVRPITWSEANALVTGEAGTFRRDPTSQYLTATGRDDWTVWVPDLQTVRTLISAAGARGIHRIALVGLDGADPALAAPRLTR